MTLCFRPFKAVTGVQIPSGTPMISETNNKLLLIPFFYAVDLSVTRFENLAKISVICLTLSSG